MVGVRQVACWCLWEEWTTVEGRGGSVDASCVVEVPALCVASLSVELPVEALEGARGRVVEEREPLRSLPWVWLM